jgi:UDP-N-acetylglucosamine--N-acetylmuramyl-(pentapeptide) pyrophosphoryl-undecaprenol N-acetylglucosamine transferase
MTERKRLLMVMAGGTGGHVFPALAVAEQMKARGFDVCWLGTRAGIEARLVPENGIKLEFISVTGIRGKSILTLLKAPFLILLAIKQSLTVMRQYEPCVVLGMGGFASGPGGLAAKLLGIPLVVQEQNAVPGTTNRLLAKWAAQILEGFSGAFNNPLAIFTGNPVRAEITALASIERKPCTDTINILVVGGSLGAVVLNQMLPGAMQKLSSVVALNIRHQTGKDRVEPVQAAYEANGINAQVNEFIDDMAAAYKWADVVFCRAGALTVSELACAGLPSVLVPYPYAIDDHQTANAMWLANNGAAIVMQQSEMTEETIVKQLTKIISDTTVLAAMSAAAKKCAVPDSSVRVADYCEEASYA